MAEVREELLIRRALEILAEADKPMEARDVVEKVRESVELNEQELSRTATGMERFSNTIRFGSDRLKNAGWIRKENRKWQITESGRQALGTSRSLGDFYARLESDRVRVADEKQQQDRLRRLSSLMDRIEEGRWVAAGDVTKVFGLPISDVEAFLQKHYPQHTRGLVGNQVHHDELVTMAGTIDLSQRAWLVRGSSVKGVNVVRHWLEDGFCSLPAERLTSMRRGMSLGQLKELVDRNYDYLSYSARRDLAAETHQFLNRMQPGDIVMTNNEDEIHLGVITSGPQVRDDTDGMSNLRREVEWRTLGGPLDIVDLPSQVEAKLSIQGSVVDLTAELEELRTILPGPRLAAEELVTEVPPPAREGAGERVVVLKDATPGLAGRLFVDQEWLQEVVELLRYRRQVIFYGPPGTGKTFLAQEIAWHLAERDRVKLVQFHPAYSYEDFFEGFRPVSTVEGKFVGFDLAGGPLRKLTDAAVQAQEQPHIMIIDELNRANPAKVFGELYFLLEYRDRSITPLYRPENEEFLLPKNVYFIATMNTSDRSIASLDAAIRRRFAFVELHPAEPPVKDLLRKWLADRKLDSEPAELLDELNRSIAERDQQLGPSYFMDKNVYVDGGLARMWRTSILPLLEEHYLDSGTDVRARFSLDAVRRAIARRGSGSSAAP